MSRLLVAVLALVLFLAPSGIYAQGQVAVAQYPEYAGGPIDCGSVRGKYSLPDFDGKQHYWVRYWNAGGQFVKDGKVYWDGVAYDGRLLYGPNVSPKEHRVYFRLGNDKRDRELYGMIPERYFLPHQVVRDPRLTNWWMATIVPFQGEKPSKSLDEAVAKAALSEGRSYVTEAILDHMFESGVVTADDLVYSHWQKMSPERIRAVMVSYTNIALCHNLVETRRVIGSAALQPGQSANLKAGDVIEDYFWDRFGPYSMPAHAVKVMEVKPGGKLVVKLINADKEYELDVTKFKIDEFVALRRK